MRATRLCALVVGVTFAFAGSSRASDEWVFEAAQPIWTPNSITVSRSTVLTFNSGDVGVCAVIATCDSNRVMTDYGPEQRNAAFEVGLRAEVSFNSNREPPLFGDTLWVTLRGTRPPQDFDNFSYAAITAATFECIMVNAAQSPAIRFVSLRVDGEGISRRYEGVFRTAGYRRGPTQREFK